MEENFDKENFADVNYGKEDEGAAEEAKAPKKGHKGHILGIIAAVLVIAAAIFAVKTFIFTSDDAGLSNMYNSSIGIVKDGKLYHASVDGKEFARTDIRTGEKEVLANASAAFVTDYKNDIYYYDTEKSQLLRYNEKADDEVIYDGIALYPYFSGNYVYYITPDSSYGGFVRRMSLSGAGEEEIVLNVYCSYFTLESGNIIYYDPAISDLLIVKESDARSFAAAAEGAAAQSADIKAVVLLEDTAASNVNVKGRYVFYADSQDSYTLKRLDMSTGENVEIAHGIMGNYLNVYGKYLYFVSPADNHIYRCNLDGGDIRDLTGTNYARTAGVSLYKDYMVYYALVGYYNDSMQTEYTPVIVVAKADGTRMCEIPGNTDADLSTSAVPENSGESANGDAAANGDEAAEGENEAENAEITE